MITNAARVMSMNIEMIIAIVLSVSDIRPPIMDNPSNIPAITVFRYSFFLKALKSSNEKVSATSGRALTVAKA